MARRAKYAYYNFEAEEDFRLFNFLTQNKPLNIILDAPKRYRLSRTYDILVVAF